METQSDETFSFVCFSLKLDSQQGVRLETRARDSHMAVMADVLPHKWLPVNSKGDLYCKSDSASGRCASLLEV